MLLRFFHRGNWATFVLAFALGCGMPAEAKDHERRGNAALAAGRYGEALAAFSRARELAPSDPSLQRAMMRARVHLIADDPTRLAADQVDDARYEAQTLLDVEPDKKAVYLTALAQLSLREGKTDDAKTKLDEALKADAQNALAHAALGTLYLARKDGAALAKAEFAAALNSNPNHFGALVALARIKANEGDLAGAVEKLQASLLVRDDAAARLTLGTVLAQQQKPVDAILHLQRAVELDPKNIDALFALGQAFLSAGKLDEAERALSAVAASRPDANVLTALGFALSRQKKWEQARSVFDQALARDQTFAPAHYGMAMALEALGKTDEALTHYRVVVSLGERDKSLGDITRDAEKKIAGLTADPAASASASARPAAPFQGPLGADPLNSRR
ncbi:MAG: tetratricopeptide repeat protein [Polyangiaceae bacterium]|nr:tetratricopeptide repeat protein [Polyangiaceae bacterium]